MQCIAPMNIVNPRTPKNKTNRLIVPCGKCAACLTNRRIEWTHRIKHEMDASISTHFVTLTYNEENLTYTGHFATLVKSDLQNFLKRLRKRIQPYKIRYYAVGEYGTRTLRPHYHLIVFNLGIENIENGAIDKSWNMGHTYTVPANPATIHYVTKYHLNKNEHPPDTEPSFATMSRKPGIGFGYVEKNKDFHNVDKNYLLHRGGVKSRMPRYYKDKIYDEYEKRKIAKKAEKLSQKWLEDEAINEHYRKNPDVNYFDYDIQKKVHLQENYKSKINKKEKL